MGWLGFGFSKGFIFTSGVMLIASPIIIHLINRLRYKKVRFAAMEFLLESQQRNRRRVLIEQLLLLLLRILIVLALAALIARMILGAEQWALFSGAKAHHVVVLDDSASMRELWDAEVDRKIVRVNAFDKAKEVVSALASDGARRPDSQQLTVLLLSRLDEPLYHREDVNENFLTKLQARLDTLEPSHRSFSLEDGLAAAKEHVLEDETGIRHVHVVSDFRRADWVESQAIGESVAALDESKVTVNLVKTVPERHENLAIVDISGEFHVAVKDVPVEVTVRVRNDGEKAADDVRLSVFTDGQKVPGSQVIDVVQPGETESHTFHVLFPAPGMHDLEVRLAGDAYEPDDRRHAAVEVANARRVLIVDGDHEQGLDIPGSAVLQLAMVPEDTGFEPLVQSPEFLRRNPLDPFTNIYMVNVGSLPRDAVKPLQEFVASGGGLVWFLGDKFDASFYTETLYGVKQPGDEPGVFPVPLKAGLRKLEHVPEIEEPPDLVFEKHPIFDGLFVGDLYALAPHINVWDYVSVDDNRRLVDEDGKDILDEQGRPVVWQSDDNVRRDGVETLMKLRNGEPFAFEHRFGEGRVITFLTTAGPEWNNWVKQYKSYIPTLLKTQARVARTDRVPESRVVGETLTFDVDAASFVPDGRLETPDVDVGSQKFVLEYESLAAEEGEGDAGGARLRRTFGKRGETDLPGVYKFTLPRQEGTAEEQWYAFNPPADESELTLATDEEIRERLGPDVDARIQEAGNLEWLEGEEVGKDAHRALLALLVLFLLCEQLLAWRLSFHHEAAGATR